MGDLIARLDAWLRANRPDYYVTLQPGLSDTEIADLERAVRTELPDDFKELYRWRNGQADDEYSDLYDNYMWLGSTEVLSNWNVMQELLDGGEFEEANWWSGQWIPFGHDGGGNLLCLDLGGSFDGIPGQVLRFWHDAEERQIEAGSFRDWVALLVNGLEGGVLAPIPIVRPSRRKGRLSGKRTRRRLRGCGRRGHPAIPKLPKRDSTRSWGHYTVRQEKGARSANLAAWHRFV